MPAILFFAIVGHGANVVTALDVLVNLVRSSVDTHSEELFARCHILKGHAHLLCRGVLDG